MQAVNGNELHWLRPRAAGRCALRAGVGFGLTVLCAAVACGCGGSGDSAAVRPISQRLLYPSEALHVAWNKMLGRSEAEPPECRDLVRYHPAGYSRPIAHVPVPPHPFMAAHRNNNMHCDAYISDTYEAAGPLGINARVSSRTQGFGGYGTIAFDRAGRLVAVYSNGRGFQLELMDPHTLRETASYDLPPRAWYAPLTGVLPWKYIGAGMYFYLDNRDRAVVPTTRNTIEVVREPAPGTAGGFKRVREYDLAPYVVPMRWPKRDSVAWVLPDWTDGAYWFATTEGMVGAVDRDSGVVRTKRLEGEIVENSFAVGEDGVYIISDRALYRFSRNATGDIAVDWRTLYDRGSAPKAGHITRGSGTSVTLAGDTNGLVIVTDNAEPRVHLLFVKRADGAVVCRVPLFEPGRSGTDISAAAFEHAGGDGRGTGRYSALVENNWGHHSFPRSHPEPGLTRVDATRNEDGTYSCRQVWASGEKSIGVFKLSLGSGLAYMYGRNESCPVSQWYLTAIDFRTAETVYKKRTGRGVGFNNWAGALFVHPGGGVVYSTTIFGLVMIADAAG